MKTIQNDVSIKPLVTITIVLLLIRLIILPFSGVMPQDAYYFLYSQHMALSYFDHPAGVAVMIKMGTFLFGNNPAAIKFSAYLTSLVTLFVIYYLAKNFISKKAALLFICVMACTPLFGVLSWIVTPDVPLMLCWSLAVLFIYKSVTADKDYQWLLAGLFSGLAVCSKYTGVFIPFGLLLYVLGQTNRWQIVFSKRTILYLVAFLVAISPLVIWNMQHQWASFAFQTTQRASEVSMTFQPQLAIAVIVVQLLLLFPWLFFYYVKGIRIFKNDDQRYFLVCFSYPLFLSFLALSFFYWVKINWMMPAFITGAILAFQYFSLKQARLHIIIALIFYVLAAFVIIAYPFPVKSHDTWWGWKEVATETKTIQAQTKVDFIFATDNYKTSAILRLHMQQPVYAANIIHENALQFDYLDEDINALKGKNALYVTNIKSNNLSKETDDLPKVKNYFNEVTLVRTQEIRNIFGQTSRVVKYYYCKGYK